MAIKRASKKRIRSLSVSVFVITVLLVLLLGVALVLLYRNDSSQSGTAQNTPTPVRSPFLYPGFQWQEVPKNGAILGTQALFVQDGADNERRQPVSGTEWQATIPEPVDPVTPRYLGIVDYYVAMLERDQWRRSLQIQGLRIRPLEIANAYEKAEGFVRLTDPATIEVVVLYTRHETLPGSSAQPEVLREFRIFKSLPIPVTQLAP